MYHFVQSVNNMMSQIWYKSLAIEVNRDRYRKISLATLNDITSEKQGVYK